MTFAGFPLIKYLECVLALYALFMGSLFIFDPATLAASVYAPWRELGAVVWGVTLIATSAAHFAALWLNGRARSLSRTIRAGANLLHLYIAIKFAVFFLTGGAPWGALTFGLLMPGLILPVLASTLQDARGAIHGR